MDGNVMLSTELDTRPVTQSLSNLKRKIVEVFKGADVKTLSASMKTVSAEIKATEAEARKAERALRDLMSGKAEPQAIKNIQTELDLTEKQAQKLQVELNALLNGDVQPKSTRVLEQELKKAEAVVAEMTPEYNRLLTEAEHWAGRDIRFMSPDDLKTLEAVKAEFISYSDKFNAAKNAVTELKTEIATVKLNPALSPEVEELRFKIQELADKSIELKATQETIRQSPLLTAEAKKYGDALAAANNRLTELRNAQEELGQSAQKVGAITRLQQTSILSGFQRIERRIMGLVRRVFFFTLITKALRAVRSQVSALITGDSQLSASLAQVKGNLATAFGTIWVSVLPAIRALINFLAKATAYLAAFISWLTGKSFKAGQTAMQSISDASGTTAGNTGKIGKAAKKAAKELNRMLLPFDQMNVLSKNTADGAGGSGGGGGAGGGAGGLGGITWPKQMDSVMAKFEKFKELIMLIGAAFAAWKLAPILSNLLEISKIRAFVGLTLIITGILMMVEGIRKIRKEGPNFINICTLIAGALLVIAGVLVLAGSPWAVMVGAIAALVLIFRELYKRSEPFRKFVDSVIKKAKELGTKLKKYVLEAVERIKKAFGKSKFKGVAQIGKEIILGILKGIAYVVKKLGTWIKKNVVEPIKKWFKKKFRISSPAKEMLEIGKNIMLGVLEGILEPIKKIGSWIQEHVLTPIKEALFGGEDTEGVVVSIGTKFNETKESLTNKWNELTENVQEKIVDLKAKVAQKWADLKSAWESLTENVKEKVADLKAKVAQKWDDIKTAWTSLTENVKEKVANMKASVAQKWADIKSSWYAIVDNVKDKTAKMKASVTQKWADIKTAWNNLTSGIKNKTVAMKAAVTQKWSDLKGAWTKLTSNFKDVKKTVSLKFSATGTNLKSWINTNVIDRINSHIPKSLKSLGFKIPRLAQGAVIPANKEFLAVLGDQKRGTNIEAPLQTIVDAFNTALRTSGYGSTPNVNVYLQGDAKQLFRVVRVEANNYTQSTGKAAFNL